MKKIITLGYKLQKLKYNLDYSELNIDSAKYWIKRAASNTNNIAIINSRLSNIEILKGNYEQALTYLNDAKCNEEKCDNVNLDKTIYFIRINDFETALELISKINYYNLTPVYLKIYKFLIQYINNELNLPIPDLRDLSNVLDYKFLVSKDITDVVSMEHAKKHFSSDNNSDNKFFSNVSYTDLVEIFEEQKGNRKPLISLDVDIYNLESSEDVASIDGIPTRHFKVVTILNSNKIISIYPFLPSYSYNIEGYSKLTKKVRRK